MLTLKGGTLRYVFLFLSLAIWSAIGKFLLNLNSVIDLIHFTVVPFWATYLFIFHSKINRKDITSGCVYLSVLVLVVLTYFITFVRIIPNAKINWLEPPITIYFLLSVYILLHLLNKTVNFSTHLIFGKIIKNKPALAVTKTTVRLGILIFFVMPYLVAVFMTHWVKFADADNPKGMQNMKYSKISFPARDGVQLNGWFINCNNRISDSTIIIVPGKNTGKNIFLPYAKLFSENGYNVLLFDLRGSGGSDGHKYSFTVNEVYDVLGAADYIQKEQSAYGNYIFGYGINEGASALITAASIDERLAAVAIDNACGYEISFPKWLAEYVPQWMEKRLLIVTKAVITAEIGREIPNAEEMNQNMSQISPCPILVANSFRNNEVNRIKTIELFTNAREPKKLWLAPSANNQNSDGEYFMSIMETFDTGKMKQQIGNWRISKKD